MNFFAKFLNGIEKVGNSLPNPLTLFFLLALMVPPLSALLYAIGVSVIHPVTGETQGVVNLMDRDGLQRILTSAVSNFTGFAPLGLVLVAMIGIGVAEKSGMITSLLKFIISKVGQKFVTPALVFAGIMSSLAVDAGYIILPPLGALIFASLGRHPLAGLCAALAGVSGAFSANLFITLLDPLLSGITQEAAQIYDPDYRVTPLANYYLMIASTFLLVPLAWFITEKIVEPRLGKWDPPKSFQLDNLEQGLKPIEAKGLLLAGITFVGCLATIAFLVIPEGSLLRSPTGGLDPFYDALIILLVITLFLPGLVYGIFTKSIRNDHDVARMTGETMSTMGTYIVLAFAAAQFIAYFNWSNLGFIFAIAGADFLKWLGLGHIPLLLGIIVVSGTINLFIGSASAKWALMAVVLVPMMMNLGYSPELTQAAFRIGDSITNIITPISPYFPIILAFAAKYIPGIRLGTIIAAMIPYSIAFAIGWAFLLVIWMTFGWNLGPDAGLLYPPTE